MESNNNSSRGLSDPSTTSPAVGGEIHPHGILAAIGYIERNFANEKGGCLINAEFLTTPQRTEFYIVGIKSGIVPCVVMMFLSPLAIGVHDNLIPMFGNAEASLFDQFNAALLTLVFTFSYSGLIAWTATRYIGGYSKAMVQSLLRGVYLSSIMGAVAIFILYHFIYFNVLSDQSLYWAAAKLSGYKIMSMSTLESVYNVIVRYRPILVKSAYFVVIATFFSLMLPAIAFWRTKRRNARWIEVGLVEVYDDRD